MKHTWYLKNLDCGLCAKEIENALKKEGFQNVSLTFPESIISFECEEDELAKAEEVIKATEDVEIIKEVEEHHEHTEECECGHEHHHHHEEECGCG
ncbi:MAG: hypothetical protein HUJ57_07760, partial [Erysipelotrichaceae bacterium]|nr:hypothetical protein [Erysipelotrichaceae bacterium]